jgi:hypothetical protein
MMIELIVRFIIGGLVVCVFAVIGDVFRPKTFAGIFGAAPSVALATLGLTFAVKGAAYAGTEGKSMLVGAIAFLVYSVIVGRILLSRKANSLVTTGTMWLAWGAVAFGLYGVVLR